jgi:uncharacterized membrane protein YcjF (UPF0283 family)
MSLDKRGSIRDGPKSTRSSLLLLSSSLTQPTTKEIKLSSSPSSSGAKYVPHALLQNAPLSVAEQLVKANAALSFNKLLCYFTSVTILLIITLMVIFYFIYKRNIFKSERQERYYYEVVIYGGAALISFLIILAIVLYLFKSIICCMKEKREKIRRDKFDEKQISMASGGASLAMDSQANNSNNRKKLMAKNAKAGSIPATQTFNFFGNLDGGSTKEGSNLDFTGKGMSSGLRSQPSENARERKPWSMDKIICCTGMSLIALIIVVEVLYVYYLQHKFGLEDNKRFYEIVVYGGACLMFMIICFTLLIFFIKKVYKCFRKSQAEKKQKKMDQLMAKINKRKNRNKNRKGQSNDEDDGEEEVEEDNTSCAEKIKNFLSGENRGKSKMKIKKKRKSLGKNEEEDEAATRRLRRRSISDRRASLGNNIASVMFTPNSLIWEIVDDQEYNPFSSNPYTQPEIVANFTAGGGKRQNSATSNLHSADVTWREQFEVLENRRINLLILSTCEEVEQRDKNEINIWDDDSMV